MMKKKSIAILGTKGIPNAYGGFEQFAEYLSIYLKKNNFDVTVYNPHYRNELENYYGVKIIRKYCPENLIGSSAHFIYDFLCLKDAINKNFDLILELGYHSLAPSLLLLNKKNSKILINMDGLEWKRSKWGRLTKKYIKYAEKISVFNSQYLISDNYGIQDYIFKKYNKKSYMIAYGAETNLSFDENILEDFNLTREDYHLIIARIEPENNIEMILDGFLSSNLQKDKFLIIGSHNNKYGKYLLEKYSNYKNISFFGGLYDFNQLNTLRRFAKIYFHGHSVGGTNPSLIEAMAARAFIFAHSNIFNKNVLENNAFYFNESNDVKDLLNDYNHISSRKDKYIQKNLNLVSKNFTWEIICCQYKELIEKILKGKN